MAIKENERRTEERTMEWLFDTDEGRRYALEYVGTNYLQRNISHYNRTLVLSDYSSESEGTDDEME